MTDTRSALRAMLDLFTEGFTEILTAADAGQDELFDGTNIWEYPLEVIGETGRPWTVVLSTGGPHIEITANGHDTAILTGYWGGETVSLYDDHEHTYSRILDLYFPDRSH